MKYEDLKIEIKKYGFATVREFMEYLGMSHTAATRWKNGKVPLWVNRIFEGLEYKKELERCEDRIKNICEDIKEVCEKKGDIEK